MNSLVLHMAQGRAPLGIATATLMLPLDILEKGLLIGDLKPAALVLVSS